MRAPTVELLQRLVEIMLQSQARRIAVPRPRTLAKVKTMPKRPLGTFAT